MGKMVKYVITAVAAVAFTLGGYAQDSRIAHPFLWKSYYNPAYTGSECNIKVDLGAQTNFMYQPSLFVDNHLNVEYGRDIKNHVVFGCGINATNEYQGGGLLNVTKINTVVGVGVYLYKSQSVSSILHVGAGLEVNLGYLNKSKMVLADQLDAYYGKISGSSAELDYISSDFADDYDLCWGIYGKTAFDIHVGHNAVIDYGFSMFHALGRINKSFYDGKYRSTLYMPYVYYPRYSGQLSCSIPFVSNRNTRMSFDMYGVYEYQAGMNDIQLGLVYHIFRFRVGVGVKVEQYINKDISFKYSATDAMFHFVYHQPLSKVAEMSIAYTFEAPLTQGAVNETAIHSISINFIINHRNLGRPCIYFPVSDNSWYEKNNTFPNGR